MGDTKGNIILKEVRSFFKKVNRKKILTFLFFVLLASIFWMMQVWRQKFDFNLTVSVNYINMPDSLIFENELPANIHVRARDDGSAIFRYLFTQGDTLIVDAGEIIRNSQNRTIQGKTFDQLVRSQLLASTELISYFPNRLYYTYAILHQKKVPVIYDGYINLAPGHLIDGALSITPDSAMVYGSRAALDTIHYAYTSGDTLNNITTQQKIQIKLSIIQGVKIVPNSVELFIPVDEFVKKTVEVPVVCVNLPPNLKIRIFPSSVKIPLTVGKRSDNVSESDFQVTIDYNDIKAIQESGGEVSIPVRITESPGYIQTEVPIPSEVEFVLEEL